jgi:hypothetical protein
VRVLCHRRPSARFRSRLGLQQSHRRNVAALHLAASSYTTVVAGLSISTQPKVSRDKCSAARGVTSVPCSVAGATCALRRVEAVLAVKARPRTFCAERLARGLARDTIRLSEREIGAHEATAFGEKYFACQPPRELTASAKPWVSTAPFRAAAARQVFHAAPSRR